MAPVAGTATVPARHEGREDMAAADDERLRSDEAARSPQDGAGPRSTRTGADAGEDDAGPVRQNIDRIADKVKGLLRSEG